MFASELVRSVNPHCTLQNVADPEAEQGEPRTNTKVEVVACD